MTPIARVLVVAKKTTYRRFVMEQTDARIASLLERGDVSVRKLLKSHEDHEAAIAEVIAALDGLGMPHKRVEASALRTAVKGDLVVTVGGDGTLLRASHEIGDGIPVLGINSAPRTSVGFFCYGKKGSAGRALRGALAGKLPRAALTRMHVSLNDRTISNRVLNEALFCHASPAATSRYILRVESPGSPTIEEEQRSSGLWIGPAAGSTAAQKSAGGRVLPLLSRKVQVVVREPYTAIGQTFRYRRGLVNKGGRVVLVSKMREAKLFLDGHDRVFDVTIGDVVVMKRSDERLIVLGLHSSRAKPGA